MEGKYWLPKWPPITKHNKISTLSSNYTGYIIQKSPLLENNSTRQFCTCSSWSRFSLFAHKKWNLFLCLNIHTDGTKMCKLLTTDIPTVHFLENISFLLLIINTQNPYKKFCGGTVMASDTLDYATQSEHDIPFITHFTSQSVVFSEWNSIFNDKSWVDSSGIDCTAIEEIC